MNHFWLYNNKSGAKLDQATLEQTVKLLSNELENLDNWFAWKTEWPNWKSVKEVSELTSALDEATKKTAKITPPLPPPLPPTFNTQILSTPNEAPKVISEEQFEIIDNKKEDDSKFENTGEIVLSPHLEENTVTIPPDETHQSPAASSQTTAASGDDARNLRRHPRYNIRFKVIIENDVITFRTFTSNISLSGVALEHPIPEKLLANNCRIYISDMKSPDIVAFSIKPIQRGNDLKYFSFDNLDTASIHKLEQWLKLMMAN